jgi:hypothetical protein
LGSAGVEELNPRVQFNHLHKQPDFNYDVSANDYIFTFFTPLILFIFLSRRLIAGMPVHCFSKATVVEHPDFETNEAIFTAFTHS